MSQLLDYGTAQGFSSSVRVFNHTIEGLDSFKVRGFLKEIQLSRNILSTINH